MKRHRYTIITIEQSNTRDADVYVDWEGMVEETKVLHVLRSRWKKAFGDRPQSGPVWELCAHYVHQVLDADGEVQHNDFWVIDFVLSQGEYKKVAWLNTPSTK